jgi:hypothetical protein
MKSQIFLFSLLILCLVIPKVKAPILEKTLAVKFYDMVVGTEDERRSAYAGFKRWPEHFGHSQQEIYDLIDKETEGKFHVKAYNSGTRARGLCQVRQVALEDIAPPPGRSFFRYKKISETQKIKFLNKKIIYRPYHNIYAGCAYYRRCKKMARPKTVGRFSFSREEVAKIYYIAGIGTWRRSFVPTLRYIQ